MKIAIVTDTSALIEEEDLKKHPNLYVLPLIIVDGEDSYEDTVNNFIKHDLKNRIQKQEPVKTSMTPVGVVEEFYDKLLEEYDLIYHFPIPSNLSSMYNSLVVLSRSDKYINKVIVFEHYQAAAQLGEMMKAIATTAANNPNLSITDIEEILKKWKENSYTFVIPSDIARLSKSGRAKSVLISFLKILRTKVCILWGEPPKKFAFSPRISKISEKIAEFINVNFKERNCLIYIHKPFYLEDNEREVNALISAFKDLKIEQEIVRTPNVYVVHAGDRTFGVSIVSKDLVGN